MIRCMISADVLDECRRRFQVESWAGRRRFRQEGVHALVGPRDRLVPAVHYDPNVAGLATPFRFAIRPAFHPDESPEPSLLEDLIDSAKRMIKARFRRA